MFAAACARVRTCALIFIDIVLFLRSLPGHAVQLAFAIMNDSVYATKLCLSVRGAPRAARVVLLQHMLRVRADEACRPSSCRLILRDPLVRCE